VASFIWAVALGIVLGCAAVVHHGRWPDWLIGVLSVGLVAVPSFVVSLYSLLIFAVTLNWLPAIGAGEPGDFGQVRALILPSFAIGLGWVGYVSRIVRAAMIEAMGEDYVRTLRSFGVGERRIIYRYALKQAFLAVLVGHRHRLRRIAHRLGFRGDRLFPAGPWQDDLRCGHLPQLSGRHGHGADDLRSLCHLHDPRRCGHGLARSRASGALL
jgi:hypothetical protein